MAERFVDKNGQAAFHGNSSIQLRLRCLRQVSRRTGLKIQHHVHWPLSSRNGLFSTWGVSSESAVGCCPQVSVSLITGQVGLLGGSGGEGEPARGFSVYVRDSGLV